jgi:hypothetical protein
LVSLSLSLCGAARWLMQLPVIVPAQLAPPRDYPSRSIYDDTEEPYPCARGIQQGPLNPDISMIRIPKQDRHRTINERSPMCKL